MNSVLKLILFRTASGGPVGTGLVWGTSNYFVWDSSNYITWG